MALDWSNEGRMTTMTIGPLQLAGLICHADQGDLDALGLDGSRMTFDPTAAGRLAEIVNAASNSADAQHERERNPDDRRMAESLGALASRIRKVG